MLQLVVVKEEVNMDMVDVAVMVGDVGDVDAMYLVAVLGQTLTCLNALMA
jgi:hypothetical protein